MDTIIDFATDLTAQHPGLAVLIAFIGALVEAVAVLGMLLPGTPVLIAVAAAAALAGLPMAPILLAAVLGAVLGDGISFWLGRRFGGRVRTVWPFSRRPELLGHAETFFRRYGLAGIALARFVPVLRSTVPLVAGMTRMPTGAFVVANVASALVWAPAHVYAAQLASMLYLRLRSTDLDWWMAVVAGLLLAVMVAGFAIWHRRLRAAALG